MRPTAVCGGWPSDPALPPHHGRFRRKWAGRALACRLWSARHDPPASVHLRTSRGTRGAQIFRESSARGVARRPRPHCIDATQRRGGGQIPELSVAMVLAYLRRIYALFIIKIKAPTRYSAAWAMIARWGRPTQKHAETRCSFTMLSQPLRSPRDPPPSLRV